MKLHEQIIHTFQVSHSLHCNDQARVTIEKLCKIAENTSERKWNELNIWLRNNPLATVEDVQEVQTLLDNGKSVRGFRIEEKANTDGMVFDTTHEPTPKRFFALK